MKGREKTVTPVGVSDAFENVAQAFLELLALRGIEYFFANPGTDFVSIVDAFSKRLAQGKEFPRPVAVPHEAVLVNMAQGYYLATGKPQAAMVHVGVGTANALGGLIMAERGRIPILFAAGRTPVTEEGSSCSRDGFWHWGQECYDQAGMVREYVRWDYEMRTPSQLETVVDRAMTMAMTHPRGPVYLTLPREILASSFDGKPFRTEFRYDLPTFHPDPAKIQAAANLLAKARFPVVITSALGRKPEAVEALTRLVETGAIAVVSFNPEYLNFPVNHQSHQGYLPHPLLPEADVILVIECDVPWYPNTARPGPSASIIQAGIDPFYGNYPIRGFPSDITIQGDPAVVLSDLSEALVRHPDRDEKAIEERGARLKKMHDVMQEEWLRGAQRVVGDKPLDINWVSHELNRHLPEGAILVNEYDMRLTQLTSGHLEQYYGPRHASYLGWGLGTALGLKLALPDRPVIATVGDGAYLFSVPSSCHFVSAAQNLPLLVIIFNNQCWNTVRLATRSAHPDSWAVRTDQYPLSVLQPTGEYEKICEAFGGYGEKVTSPDQVGPAIDRALSVVMDEGRQAVLNMMCKHP